MKKAKIVFAALAILAVAGGTMAFKANKAARIQTTLYRPLQLGVNGVCTIPVVTFATFTDEANGAFAEYTTLRQQAPCPTYTTQGF